VCWWPVPSLVLLCCPDLRRCQSSSRSSSRSSSFSIYLSASPPSVGPLPENLTGSSQPIRIVDSSTEKPPPQTRKRCPYGRLDVGAYGRQSPVLEVPWDAFTTLPAEPPYTRPVCRARHRQVRTYGGKGGAPRKRRPYPTRTHYCCPSSSMSPLSLIRGVAFLFFTRSARPMNVTST
jgi:hypothetical protein